MSEVASHMRALCLSGPSGNEAAGDLVAGQVTAAPAPGPGPQSYVVPRQHYTQVMQLILFNVIYIFLVEINV